ncbi:MAG: SDR family NAD(P)-dependent oxidoreductase [Planctomycetota bacterium]|jgi:3-oxoacyl-[acyl-carrier protein] reductase
MKPPIDSPHPFVAVVTGSSSGIGQAIAVELASRGAHVLIHARSNLAGLQKTIALIRARQSSNSALRCIVADLTSSPSIDAMVRAAFAWTGYVNTWVHAAGADVLTGSQAALPFETKLQTLWETDVRGTMLTSRSVSHQMIARGVPHPLLPSIVHLGWDQAEQGMEGDSGQFFCAVKAAVAAFSKSLAKSVAPKVRVNCVAPGWIQTEWGFETSEPWNQRAQGESLLQRWGTPSDVARFVASISMGDGEFINAQTLAVNGGWCSAGIPIRSRMTRDPRPPR